VEPQGPTYRSHGHSADRARKGGSEDPCAAPQNSIGKRAKLDPDLLEWNHGDYEGLTEVEILKRRPGWMVITGGCPHGESATLGK
jgi:broad specificity phosphatase PhoE